MQAMIIAANEEEREFLSWAVRQTGLTIHRGSNVETISKSLLEQPVDLILFAVESGERTDEGIKMLRSASQAPIIFIADWASEAEHCALLDAGGDLVIKRPFSPRVLMRYVRVFLRRAGAIPISVLPEIEAENIRLLPNSRMLLVPDKQPQHLTQLEFRLIYILMTNSHQVIPIDTIVDRVWGYTGESNKELVRGLVRRLRLKVEPDPNRPQFIHNVPGIGYQFSRYGEEE